MMWGSRALWAFQGRYLAHRYLCYYRPASRPLVHSQEWNQKALGFPTHRPSSHEWFYTSAAKTIRTRGAEPFLPGQVKLSSTTAAALMLCLWWGKQSSSWQPNFNLLKGLPSSAASSSSVSSFSWRSDTWNHLTFTWAWRWVLAQTVSHCDDVSPPAIKSKEVVG